MIDNSSKLAISRALSAGTKAYAYKSWIGQRRDNTWSHAGPKKDPTEPTAPYKNTDLKGAVGGLGQLYPTYKIDAMQKTIKNIIDDLTPTGTGHGNWNDRQSGQIGLAENGSIVFIMATHDAASNHMTPDIELHKVVQNLVDSVASVVMELDGGQSCALAHTNPQGKGLAVKTKGDRHTGAWWRNLVNNYIILVRQGAQ